MFRDSLDDQSISLKLLTDEGKDLQISGDMRLIQKPGRSINFRVLNATHKIKKTQFTHPFTRKLEGGHLLPTNTKIPGVVNTLYQSPDPTSDRKTHQVYREFPKIRKRRGEGMWGPRLLVSFSVVVL